MLVDSMNKKLKPYVIFALQLKSEGESDQIILDSLKEQDVGLAVAIRTMERLGLDLDKIDRLISRSKVWKNESRSFEDLFFDFVELDDDNIANKS